MGDSPWIVHILVILAIFVITGSSFCRVELCSRQYTRAINKDNVQRGPTYFYCTILKSYSDCIKATAKSCRGNLDYHSVSSLVYQWNNQYNCTLVIAQGPLDPPVQPTTLIETKKVLPECSFKGSKVFGYCGFFGDPHLRTVYNELQTCRVSGAWPLIDNAFLAIQVTNIPVTVISQATAISKVTVIVRKHGNCATEKTYEAQKDFLPNAFIDGTKGSDDGTYVKELRQGSHVEIYIQHIETVIILRQVGNYLTFAIKIPISVVQTSEESLELCVKGCPNREQINTNQIETLKINHGEELGEAIRECQKLGITDFYFDACVFDLLTTGDAYFSRTAYLAREDMMHLQPNNTALQQTGLKRHSQVSSNGPGRPHVGVLLILSFWFMVLKL